MMNETMIGKPSQRLSRWHSLTSEEQKREFLELTHSPYWDFLPEEIQGRIMRLLPKISPH